jgi:beta-lactamase regulating signal transducer with metallopeptidase domain
MIAAAMAYALVIALLVTLAALAAERILAVLRWPRRGVWAIALAASVAFPCVTLLSNEGASYSDRSPSETSVYAGPAAGIDAIAPAASLLRLPSLTWPVSSDLDAMLIALWVATSVGMLLFLACGSLRFLRTAREWPTVQMNGEPVWIADRAGPAVFGILNPRIVFPRQLLTAPSSVRSIVFRHEQSHIAARDPLLLFSALLLVALAPWNLPLWWQLRRLRFAMEVDCDARVVRDIDPVEYGETLLSIVQSRLPTPLGIAVTEPASRLERRIRIMMLERPRHYVMLAGAFLALSAAFVACTAQLEPPAAISDADLRKSPPTDSVNPLPQRLRSILEERHPQLLRERVEGIPLVFILFGPGGAVQTHAEMSGSRPQDFEAFKASFNRYFGVAPEEVAYRGEQGVLAPTAKGNNKILALFTERRTPGEAFVSPLAPDTRDIDRRIAEHYFASELKEGVPTRERLWVLLDSEGRILKSGKAPTGTGGIGHALEAQFPGIRSQYVTVTPITDRSLRPMKDLNGKPLQLHSVWLAADSRQPNG